jgi:hypothetical protein
LTPKRLNRFSNNQLDVKNKTGPLVDGRVGQMKYPNTQIPNDERSPNDEIRIGSLLFETAV